MGTSSIAMRTSFQRSLNPAVKTQHSIGILAFWTLAESRPMLPCLLADVGARHVSAQSQQEFAFPRRHFFYTLFDLTGLDPTGPDWLACLAEGFSGVLREACVATSENFDLVVI